MSNALVIAVRRRRCWPARLVYLALDWALAVVLAVALLIVAERVFLPAGWVCGLVGLLEVHRASLQIGVRVTNGVPSRRRNGQP